ncbi:MAG: hypothetical protein HN341_14520 [Verrucomicrobia bacterium]|jgi:hypothetical protein|nr:hypothetical protein [Verrucomicrobiota bacterium]
MKRRITLVAALILSTACIAILATRDTLVIRYHAWQTDRLYGRVMLPDATDSERKALREDIVFHADRLVQLGHWKKKTFEIHLLPKQEDRVRFMDFMLAAPPLKKDSGYFQFWGQEGTNGPQAFLNLWCGTDDMPKMEELLNEKNVLITEEGQHIGAP